MITRSDAFHKCPSCNKPEGNDAQSVEHLELDCEQKIDEETVCDILQNTQNELSFSVKGYKSNPKSDIAIRLAEKIEKDRTVAQNTLEFYQYMAGNNNIEAQFELGELYNRSDLDLYNPHEAARWYDYAAVQGHKDAFFELEDLKFDDGRYDAWV